MSTFDFRLGRALPRSLFGAALAALTVAASAAVPAQEALPPARTILDRHVAAIGGRQALMAHSSIRLVGTLSIPAAGITGSLEAFAAKPNKVLVKSTIPGVGDVLEGFDGTVAWSVNPMTGPAVAVGKELDQKKFDADFYGELREQARYKSATTVEKTIWEGRPAYKISLVRHDGSEEFEYYDVESGFRTGREITREAPVGSLKVKQVITDYRKFGDLMHATRATVDVMSVQQLITISSVEYDKVDPSVFELPAAIKALVKIPAGQ